MESETLKREWTLCLAGFLALGVCARVAQYVQYNSLGLDEAALAFSIVTKSYGELFGPLHQGQMAPPLYLIVVKLCAQLFGENEYALRLPSLLASLVGLGVFYALAASCVDRRAAILGTAFFATSGHLIFYAYQCKPYASDVCVFMIVVWASLWVHQREPLTWRHAGIYGLVGAVCVWASYPAAFVMAGAGGALLVHALLTKDYDGLSKVSAAVAMWVASFALLYFVNVRAITDQGAHMENMDIFWKDGFMPLPPMERHEFAWFKERFLLFFWMPGGFRLTGLAGFAFLVGVYALWKRDRVACAAFVLPIVVTLLVSGLHKYPFEGRMTLFLSPTLFLMLGVAGSLFWRSIDKQGVGIALLLLVLLLAPATGRAGKSVVAPRQSLDYADALKHIRGNWQDGDLVYIASPDQNIFRFCGTSKQFEVTDVFIEPDAISIGHAQESFYAEQAPMFREHGRVWFPMVYEARWAIEPYLVFLEQHGRLAEEYTTRGAGVFLYEFE